MDIRKTAILSQGDLISAVKEYFQEDFSNSATSKMIFDNFSFFKQGDITTATRNYLQKEGFEICADSFKWVFNETDGKIQLYQVECEVYERSDEEINLLGIW